MRNFLLGFIAAVVLVGVAVFAYIRFGFVDPRADMPVGVLESKLAMPALDAAVDRRAPDVKNPLEANEANLAAGMKIYQTNCAGCHGDIHQPHSEFGDALYPHAPQFLEDAPDMPENQNFYIIQHGIRLSGMPANEKSLSGQQTWLVTTFLSHMDKLPQAVSDQWKALAGGAAQQDSTSHSSSSMDKMDMH
jgi:mono/diheme cytochrome c family protein